MSTGKYYSRKIIFILSFLLFRIASSHAERYVMGGKSGWDDITVRDGITSGKGRFGYECLELASASSTGNSNTDLLLNFENGVFRDAAGKYKIIGNSLYLTEQAARGKTAALSRGNGHGLILSGDDSSLFGKEGPAGSFVIDFWLCPSVIENGETLINWRSSRKISGALEYQLVSVYCRRNKVFCIFSNIFDGYTADGGDVTLTGSGNLIPNKWSHLTIAFQESTGALEYRLNGMLEDIKYVTTTGHDGGSVYPAVIGVPAELELCRNYTGLIDDFRILRSYYDISHEVAAEQDAARFAAKYGTAAGKIMSKPILTSAGSVLNSIDAELKLPEQTAVQFYVRAGDNYFNWTDAYPAWTAVKVGEDIKGLSGLYFQVAAELFADGAGKSTPSITEIALDYTALPPPLPPFRVSAQHGDGQVTLSWNHSVDDTAGGYYIYYGTRPGEYLSRAAAEGASPVDAGSVTSYTLTGLKNGTIYYFAIAAWSKIDSRICGDLSKEVYARPSIR